MDFRFDAGRLAGGRLIGRFLPFGGAWVMTGASRMEEKHHADLVVTRVKGLGF
jgi:hypothetical protein